LNTNNSEWDINKKINWCLDSIIIGHCDEKCISFMTDIKNYIEYLDPIEIRALIPELIYVGQVRKIPDRKYGSPNREQIFKNYMNDKKIFNKKQIREGYNKQVQDFKYFFTHGLQFWRDYTNYTPEVHAESKKWVEAINDKYRAAKSKIIPKKVSDYNPTIHVIKKEVKKEVCKIQTQKDLFE